MSSEVALPTPGRARRLWSAVTGPAGFRLLAIGNAVMLWLIVPSGGVVRLTGSGLGCSDWPLCDDGGILPAASQHAWIEFTNRMLSGVVMALAVVTWIVARRLPGRPRGVRRASLVAALATVGQVPLGAVTVLFDLHPLLVASHFLLSMVALAAGAACAVEAVDRAAGRRRAWAPRQGAMALVALAALASVIVSGVLVTAAGPHSGDPEVVGRFGDLERAAYVHVRLVVAFAAVAVVLALITWRTGRHDRGTRLLALAFVPVLAVQATIGEVQWRSQLPWELVVAHVSLAGLVWGIGVALGWRLMRPAVPPAPGAADRARSAAAEAVVTAG